MRAPRSAYRSCRSTCPSRWRWSSRSTELDRSRRLPAHLVQNARAFAEGGRTPAEARDASTVVLLRDGDGREGGIEVYLLRRVVDMAFAGGYCVFPGGGVDARDFDADIGWAGPSSDEWARLLSTSEEHARAL